MKTATRTVAIRARGILRLETVFDIVLHPF
jgi:hypothetical protein